MVVNGVGYLGKACMRAETVRFGAPRNLTLAAATINHCEFTLATHTLSCPNRTLGVLHDASGAS